MIAMQNQELIREFSKCTNILASNPPDIRKSIGDSTGGLEGAQAPLLKNKFLKVSGESCT